MSSSVAPDDRGASRPHSGILTPSSDGSLNYAGGTAAASPVTRTKRRSDPAMQRLLKPCIAVKVSNVFTATAVPTEPPNSILTQPSPMQPHPHALHVQPKTLSPLFLLRRQNLPLGCIDFQATTTESTYTRLVESRIKILDLETRMGSTQSVLIARHDATRTVYAIERQNGGLYAMCKLGAWVDLEQLAQDATALCPERVFPVKAEAESPPQPLLATMTPHMISQQKKKRAAIEAIQSLVRKKPKAEPGPSSDEAILAPEVQRRVWDRALQPTPEVVIPFVKKSIEETPVPDIIAPKAAMPEIMVRYVKQADGSAAMPEVMIPHNITKDETPMPEVMIRYFKQPDDSAPMPEVIIPHNMRKKREEPMPEVMIPYVKPAPEETPVALAMSSQARPHPGETQGESSMMGAPSVLPSSQLHAAAIEDDTQDVATSIFENIRAHYFEALYKSMGSLAYFAKGPLSRARSTFHLDLEANLDMADLIEFLKSLILTTVQIDKKYRETAPEIISQLSAIVESSDETRSKKRRPKKMRLGKNGLYPNEDDRIRKWWNANKPELDDEQPSHTAMQIKSNLSLLRTRETQLQMILIMEILALEPLKAVDDVADSSLPVLPGGSASGAHRSPASAQTKKRNKHNLPVLIDVHADRLTIWQSTATDEQQLAEDSQANRQNLSGNRVLKTSSEPLKDFCTDVVVPFFSARVPEICDAINRKLGGPVIVPAGSGKSQKRSMNKKEQKPGSATKRPAAPRPPRTLQRALSTDQQSRRSVSRGPSNMIALMRSATSTSLPTIRRDGSDSANLKRLLKKEGEVQKRPALSRSSSNVASQDGAKANRQALVDAQVKDAIAALRKPNREVVGQAMEEADQQKALAVKKTRRMQRSSVVKATPANNRFKDVFAHTQGIPDSPMHHMEDVIPPSSIGPFIPSTDQRNGFRNPMDLNTSPAIDTVGNTPTKRATKATFLHRTKDEPCVPPSPLARTSNPALHSLPTTMSANGLLQPPKSDEGTEKKRHGRDHVFATPAKKEKYQQDLSASPVAQLKLQGETKSQKSIYETLGWDDDYDI